MLKEQMNTDEKARAFDMVLDAYDEDSDLSQFGRKVQETILFLKKFYAFKK